MFLIVAMMSPVLSTRHDVVLNVHRGHTEDLAKP
jgi:hypothetical protein